MKQSIGKLIKLAHYALNSDLEKLAQPYGITGVQMTIIDFIGTSLNEITQRDIEKEFHIQGSTVTVMIDRLEAKKLVKRYKSEDDKRINKIKLTDSGLGISEVIEGHIDNHDGLILSGYSEEEKNIIFNFLDSIIKRQV